MRVNIVMALSPYSPPSCFGDRLSEMKLIFFFVSIFLETPPTNPPLTFYYRFFLSLVLFLTFSLSLFAPSKQVVFTKLNFVCCWFDRPNIIRFYDFPF
jgi:hypothetical protein